MSERRPRPAAADLYGDLLDTGAPRIAWRDYLPGLVITGVAALAAAYLSEHYGAPIMLMGLLIGLAFNFANADRRLHPGLGLASTTLLRWGIVLLGLQVTVGQIAGLGWAAFLGIVGIVAVVTLSGALIVRRTGGALAYGVLAGGSVAICGASAALALATVLGERRVSQAQLTLVLVAISAASAVAMPVYPTIVRGLGFGEVGAGFVLGASIHDVAQALGAGYSYSPEAGQTATIVKLTRVALLAPVLAVVAYGYNRKEGRAVASLGLPWFVAGFFALVAANSMIALPVDLTAGASRAASALLLLAVTATGIRSPMALLLEQGWAASLPVVAATLVSLGAALLVGFVLF